MLCYFVNMSASKIYLHLLLPQEIEEIYFAGTYIFPG